MIYSSLTKLVIKFWTKILAVKMKTDLTEIKQTPTCIEVDSVEHTVKLWSTESIYFTAHGAPDGHPPFLKLWVST